MWTKIIGAFCIVCVCGGYACRLASFHRKDEHNIQQLLFLLQFMESELQYRFTPLPELCRISAQQSHGVLSSVFSELYHALLSQRYSNANDCMSAVLQHIKDIPPYTTEILGLLGAQLGCFDLNGQVRCLDSVMDRCHQLLSKLNDEHNVHVRHYKTIGLCAAAALIIILI